MTMLARPSTFDGDDVATEFCATEIQLFLGYARTYAFARVGLRKVALGAQGGAILAAVPRIAGPSPSSTGLVVGDGKGRGFAKLVAEWWAFVYQVQ